jgi:hypothetical protein
MILTQDKMAVIKAHGGRVTRLQANMLAGTSNRNALIRKGDGRDVWFPDDYTTALEIEDGDEIELVPAAYDIPNGVSSVARMGGEDE